jgi:hypothetical protein
MSAYINAAAHDADEVLSGFGAFLKDGVSAIEAATVLSAAAFIAVILNALL